MSGISGANAKFAELALEKILSVKDHPLSFLVDRTTGKWLSRASGVDDVPAMQVGHMISKFSGALQRLALEDADRNQWASRFGETFGVVFDKQAILIGDVPIMLDTALSYERMGELPAGTCALALSSDGWSPRWGMGPDQAAKTNFQPIDAGDKGNASAGVPAPVAGAAGAAGGTGVLGLLGGLVGLIGLTGAASAKSNAEPSPPASDAAGSASGTSSSDSDDDDIPWCIDHSMISVAPSVEYQRTPSESLNYIPSATPMSNGADAGTVFDFSTSTPWSAADGTSPGLQSLLQDGPDTGISYSFLADSGTPYESSQFIFNYDGSVSGYIAADSILACIWSGDDSVGGLTDSGSGSAWADPGPAGGADGGYSGGDF